MGKQILASANEWVLFDTGKGANGWRSLKLKLRGRGKIPKRNWWIGFNGERFARNHDLGVLARHNPDVLAWVLAAVKNFENGG